MQVPKLCATDNMEAFGSCRLCLVEIEGRRGTPASCTTLAESGMKVRTQSPKIAKLRRGVMELYISDHPLDCLTCARQRRLRIAGHGGRGGVARSPLRLRRRESPEGPQKDESNPYFTFEASKCIVCSRCVRACEEVQGTFALTIQGRGFASKVASGPTNFLDSECVSCGACVQACPTATLMEKTIIAKGQPEHSVVTTCAYCGVGCAFKAEMQGAEVVRMMPYKDGKANHGHSCVKGRFAWGYATHKDRITKPMIRAKITDPVARSHLGRGHQLRGQRVQTHPGQVRPRFHRRHHFFALHQRRDLPGAEDDPRRVRQQQRGHLRARLPFADGLRPEDNLRNFGGNAGFRFGGRRPTS